ncbi:MAG: hypothetical protein MUC63_05085 [Planctomycetes bacterium]|nr:hypothetical protein [Planctomycetota bacterium]
MTSEPLRRLELLFLCSLFLALCAALAWSGVGFLREGEAVFPLVRLVLPFPAGSALGVLFLALAAGIAAATLALGIRFRR